MATITIDNLLGRGRFAVPKVGDGATINGYSDQHAGTVIAVSKSGKTCTVRQDTATRTDSNGRSDCQSYDYSPNPEGKVYRCRMTKRGWKVLGSCCMVGIGYRREYYDYTF